MLLSGLGETCAPRYLRGGSSLDVFIVGKISSNDFAMPKSR